MFFVKNVVLPAWELISESSYVFLVFFAVGAHLRNSGFTCMGAQFPRVCLRFLCFFLSPQWQTNEVVVFLFFPLQARKGAERRREEGSGEDTRREGKRREEKTRAEQRKEEQRRAEKGRGEKRREGKRREEREKIR